MSDLVQRLRDHVIGRLPGSEPAIRNGAWDMMLQAADEIERLRAELDRAHEREASNGPHI
jgi:hypothetical protein